MERAFGAFKLTFATLGSFIAAVLGGYDSFLSLLVCLIFADLITGVINACLKKELSSRKLYSGVLRKLFVFLVIVLAVRVDVCIVEATGNFIHVGDTSIRIRTFFILYFCLEEGVSLLENLTELGVPFPKWLKSLLKQVSDCTNSTTPQWVVTKLSRYFKNLDLEKNSEDNKDSAKSYSSNEGNSENSEG